MAAFRRARKSSDTLLTFLLRCHRPETYNISHAENVSEKAYDKNFAVNILYQTGEKTMQELLDFPTMYDPPEVAAEKQRRLLEMTPAKNAPVSA